MAKKKEQQKQQLKPLRIEWNTPDYIITRFATNMLVQIIENEFKISFFEIQPPIIFSDEDRKKVHEMGTIKAECVGSIIVTPERLPGFIKILDDQLSDYYNRKQGKKEP